MSFLLEALSTLLSKVKGVDVGGERCLSGSTGFIMGHGYMGEARG